MNISELLGNLLVAVQGRGPSPYRKFNDSNSCRITHGEIPVMGEKKSQSMVAIGTPDTPLLFIDLSP